MPYSLHPTAAAVPANVYPELGGYMGMEFDEQTIRQNMPEYLPNVQQQIAVRPQVSLPICISLTLKQSSIDVSMLFT